MLDRAQIKINAKHQIKGNIGIYFLCSLVGGLISIITSAMIIGVFIAPAISFGFAVLALTIAHNGKITFGQLFKGFNHYGKVLWLAIITAVFTFLWSLLLFIPGIVKAYAYSFAPYILAEHPEMTAREALRESKRLTNGYKGKLFVLDLSYIGWALLAVFTFGLLYIWLTPYWEAAKANYYLEICKLKGAVAANNAQQPYNAQPTSYSQPQPYNAQPSSYSQPQPNNPQPLSDGQIPVKANTEFPAQEEDEQLTTPLYSEKEISNAFQKKPAGIRCISGEYSGGEFPLTDGTELVIGRNAAMCNIVMSLANKDISQKHVVIKYNPQKNVYVVTDLSSNGTFANGQRLQKGTPTQINRGAVLSLATNKVRFVLE
ncbi:MAG: DUF975 family protein [Eubacterium sp.]